ncbi:MAG: PEP-CTERM system TPR-repeat protein PrsT [Gammaproteobacteria bacterium]|nr:PEP-CTERM system TPR-repeat protein PrsT [Gammaproteobacteria bacterium]
MKFNDVPALAGKRGPLRLAVAGHDGRAACVWGRRLLRMSLLGAVLLTGWIPQASAQSSVAALYEQAAEAFEKREFELSVLRLKEALAKDPGLLPGQILLARIYLELGAAGAADQTLQGARRLGADPAIILPLRAQALLQQRKFEQLLALIPASGQPPQVQARLHSYRAYAYMERGEDERADQSFLEATALAPSQVEPLVGRATLALRQGELDTAWARALKAAQVAPNDASVWAVKGEILHVRGRLEEALGAYDASLAVRPEALDAGLARAGLLLDLKSYDDAATQLEQLVERYPLDPRPPYLRSVLLSKQGKRGEARAQLEKAAALLAEMGQDGVVGSMQLVFLAGLANYELGALEQAQTYLRSYVDRYPQQPGARKLLGAALMRSGRSADAIVVLEPALAVSPDDPQLLTMLGSAYLENGRHEIATPYLERAARITGGAPGIRTGLALSRMSQGDEARGLQELAEVFALDPAANRVAGLALATLQMKRGRFDLALPVVDKLRELDPDNVSYLNLLGSAQFGAGRLDAGRQTFERALALNPDAMPVSVNLARLERASGRHDRARELLGTVLATRPDEVRAMVVLAAVERDVGQLDEAARWLQKATATDAEFLPAALALVDLQLARGQSNEALSTAQEAESRAPEALDVLAALARCHLAMERPDRASSIYRRMATLAGYDVAALNRVARLQLELGEVDAAEFNLTRALQKDPTHIDSRVLLSGVLIAARKYEQAEVLARQLVEELPKATIGHSLLGDIALALGRFDEAIANYGRALKIQSSQQLVMQIARASVGAGRQAEAIQFLDRWLQSHPGDTVVAKMLAESYLATGQLDEARTRYESLADGAGREDADVLNNLAYVYDKLDDPRALELAERALSVAPEDPFVLDTLGWLLVRRGEAARGLSHLREAATRASTEPQIRYHIGAALVALQRHAEARRHLRDALASAADFEGAEAARALLQQIQE